MIQPEYPAILLFDDNTAKYLNDNDDLNLDEEYSKFNYNEKDLIVDSSENFIRFGYSCDTKVRMKQLLLGNTDMFFIEDNKLSIIDVLSKLKNQASICYEDINMERLLKNLIEDLEDQMKRNSQ